VNAQSASAADNPDIRVKYLESDLGIHAGNSDGRKRINVSYDCKDLRNGQLRCPGCALAWEVGAFHCGVDGAVRYRLLAATQQVQILSVAATESETSPL
jgi:hypothetical protein